MKSFEIREFGIENLALVDRDTPSPGPFEVLVKMKAASLNYRDYMAAKGSYNPRMRRPMVPLSDGVGLVEEVGSGVTRVKKGDRVAMAFMQSWVDGPPSQDKGKSALGGALDGVAREFAVFPEQGLVHLPHNLTDVEAAALPCAAVTAWHALFEPAATAPGETVLIQGTGGVSTFALLFARAAGLRTILISSSDEKIARAKSLGANDTINYKRDPDWEKEARKLTNGVGVDQLIEVGGSSTMGRSLAAVRTYGIISVIGVLSGGGQPAVSPGQILMNSVRVQGIYVGSRTMFERMNRAIAFHNIKPVVDKVFPWTELKQALLYMEGQSHFGKICLDF